MDTFFEVMLAYLCKRDRLRQRLIYALCTSTSTAMSLHSSTSTVMKTHNSTAIIVATTNRLRINIIYDDMLYDNLQNVADNIIAGLKAMRIQTCIINDLRDKNSAVYQNYLHNAIYKIIHICSQYAKYMFIEGRITLRQLLDSSDASIANVDISNEEYLLCDLCDYQHVVMRILPIGTMYTCNSCTNSWLV